MAVQTLIPYLLINNYVTASYSSETIPYWEIYFKLQLLAIRYGLRVSVLKAGIFPYILLPLPLKVAPFLVSFWELKKKGRIFEFQATVFMKRM